MVSNIGSDTDNINNDPFEKLPLSIGTDKSHTFWVSTQNFMSLVDETNYPQYYSLKTNYSVSNAYLYGIISAEVSVQSTL